MKKDERRYYTPQFSKIAVVSVKRLSWALNLPMTKIVDFIIHALPSLVDPAKVCLSCKDRSCCCNCTFRVHSPGPSPLSALAPQ